jgi:Flp pilus assembly protein TadG
VHALAGDRPAPPRRLRGDRGASALELSLVAPGLLLFIFFSIQTGLYFYGRAVAEQAAREGVSKLRLAQTETICQNIAEAVKASVEAYAVTVGRETLLDPEATIGCPLNVEEEKVTVTVTGDVITLVPGLDLTVTQRVLGEIERFEGDARP